MRGGAEDGQGAGWSVGEQVGTAFVAGLSVELHTSTAFAAEMTIGWPTIPALELLGP